MARNRNRVGQVLGGLVAFCCLLGQPASSIASSLVLSPLRLSLATGQSISALTVRNDGDEPVVIQLELTQWKQADGKDVYTATTDVLATPPIFTIPAHNSQLVRVGLRRGADASIELSYRIFLQEVPPPPAPGFKGLRVAARFGVPIFVAPLNAQESPAIAAPSALSWQVVHASGRLVVRAKNAGAVHERVTALELTAPGLPTPLLHVQGTDYVLPGQSRDWLVDSEHAPAPGTPLHIVGITDTGRAEADGVLPGP